MKFLIVDFILKRTLFVKITCRIVYFLIFLSLFALILNQYYSFQHSLDDKALILPIKNIQEKDRSGIANNQLPFDKIVSILKSKITRPKYDVSCEKIFIEDKANITFVIK